MKILLDENLPPALRLAISGHEVFTVSDMGWAGAENGSLLRLAESSGFDVLLTRDEGLEYQQHLAALPIAVIILQSRTNQIEDLLPLVTNLLEALERLEPRTLLRLRYP